MSRRWFFAAFGLVSVALGLGLLLNARDAGIATAAVPSADISSAGPLTHVYIGNDLSCQIVHTGDASFELFPPAAIPGDCGTFVVTGGTLYGPDFSNHDGTATGSLASFTPFTPVSQSAVTGTGTVGDPFTVTTVADAGTTGLRITEKDTYISGAESYRTDVTVQNNGQVGQSALIFRAGDCYLGGTDVGFGVLNATTKAIGCTKTANNVPPDRIEVWSPLTPADHYFESDFDTVWAKIGAKASLPDTCDCAISQDNGAAIEWDRTIGAGASVILSHFTTFSPLGTQPLVASKTADAANATAGGSDGYTISIANPNAADVTVTSITDTLPAGFSYASGSSTGLTTADPGVAAQVLTWTGSFVVAGGGSSTLHFMVTVASAAGTYFNNVSGAASTDVVPTGNTAPITVSEGPTATATSSPTATSTSQAGVTDTPTATSSATSSPTVTPTTLSCQTLTASSAPAGMVTAQATRTVQATGTARATGTAQATRTVQATRTAHATGTARATQTTEALPTCETSTATPTNTQTPVPTATSTTEASATSTSSNSTQTSVPTATSTMQASATSTSSGGGSVGATATSAPSTATPIASTAAASTSTSQSSVLGAVAAPRASGRSAAAAGASTLPSTGQGPTKSSPVRYALSVLFLLAGIAILAGATYQPRRR